MRVAGFVAQDGFQVAIRYSLETKGGTRSPESRLQIPIRYSLFAVR
jgi:hypothetical protein